MKILLAILGLAFIYGYIANIVAIFANIDIISLGEVVLRCVGIFLFPIGAICGWVL